MQQRLTPNAEQTVHGTARAHLPLAGTSRSSCLTYYAAPPPPLLYVKRS